MTRRILVTGGLGFIGSHTTIQLLAAGHEVVCLDNLSNSKRAVLNRIEKIAGTRPHFIAGDIRNASDVRNALDVTKIDGVIHFAGLKAVGESVEDPLSYYDNNVSGTRTLLSVLSTTQIRQFIFSSSATVYGQPDTVPIPESASLRATNPYGRTKLFIEEMLRDVQVSDSSWEISILRYFNPVGAHPSGLLGEDPTGIPNNLMPYIAQVAVGRRETLSIFGNDYETADGTGVRDYIHVMDLADGHLAALEADRGKPGLSVYNLGTGQGCSVLEMVAAFERAAQTPIPYVFAERRAGDIATCFADCSHARSQLNWQAIRTIEDMTRDAWRWQSSHPNGLPNDAEETET